MNRLFTQMKRALGLAVIKLIDDTGPYQMVQVDLGPIGQDGKALQLRDKTPVLQHYGFSSNPPPGSDAAIIALGGDANQVLVIATGNREFRIPMPSGGAVIHDNDGHFIKIIPGQGIHSLGVLLQDGDSTINGETLVNGNMTVVAPANVILDAPAVSTTGNLAAGTGATGSFTTPTGDVVTVQAGVITNIG
jgi:phage gp45-like